MSRLLRSLIVTGAVLALIGLTVGGSLPLHAQNTPAPRQAPTGPPPPPPIENLPQPVFRTGINFVRVDVIVTDKAGNPVNDLKQGDFEITEQNRAQKVETFKLISLDGGLMDATNTPPRQIRTDIDEETEASRDDVRLFAIFLDDYHVRRETSMSARGQLARFVQTQLGPSDMIGVMYPLEPIASVRMTRNHDAVEKGLQQFLGRKYDYTPKNDYEEKIVYYPTETVEQIRNQISLSAIKSLIIHMGGLKEGRKGLILVSEGYSNMIPPQLRNANAAFPGSGNPSANDPFAGTDGTGRTSQLEERAAFMANSEMEDELRDVWDLANKNNVAIYAVDPRGLATNEFGIDQNINNTTDSTYLRSTMDTLRTLALNTDGRAIVNRNDLALGMKQIVRDNSAYYLLGYNSTFTATDGKFHEIKVKVNRPGIQVRARKGYWAFTADDAARAMAPTKNDPPKAIDNAIAAITTPSRARVVRTWLGSERGADGKTRMTFVWEPVPRAPGDPVRPENTPARVSIIAVAPDGSPYYRGKIPEGTSATPTPAGSKVSFEVKPGQMQLRVSVESAGADVLDSEVREIAVPDLTAPQVAIGTPAVYRGRTVPEYQRLKSDPQAMPTAAREFSRTERVFIRVPAYAPGTSPPTVTARLLNRSGQSMGNLTVANSAGRTESKDIDLSLAPMPPGEYAVEITATAEGSEPVKELVGFRVTS
ncbi:MAG TPA: VWA domain-containing protein [Vicinamibacterales bacterium]